VGLRDRLRRGKLQSVTEPEGAPAGSAVDGPDTGLLYADDPLTDPADDVLDRGRLAERIVSVLTAVSNQTDSAVIALVGPWGSGKSTLLNAVERHVKATRAWYPARYNPWSFSSLDGAVSGFFAELRSALPDDALSNNRRRALGELGARMAPVGALGGLVGVDASEGIRELARLVGGDQSPEKLRERAVTELASLETPVLVLIDDLDRLEPAELLLTFKLVRLLGRLPNVFYVLCYDEGTLEAVLRRTDLVGEEPGRARDYLEKMVQVRIDIPPLLDEQKVSMVNVALDAFLARHELLLDGDATVRLQQIWTNCLDPYLGQPRAVKKLFAQLDALWPEVAGEVDVVDFLGMTFLRTFEREAYDLVLRSKGELTGTSLHEFMQGDKESNRDRWGRWIKQLETAGARHPQALGLLLAEMFLTIRSARENVSYGSHYREQLAVRRGVGSPEYFDRYTQLGVPKSDLPDATLVAALTQLGAGENGEALERVKTRLNADAGFVVRKLARMVDRPESLPLKQLISLLGSYYIAASEQKSGPFGTSPDFSLLALAMQLLDALPDDAAAASLVSLCADESGLHMTLDAAQKSTMAEEGGRQRSWPAKAVELAVPAAVARLKLASTRILSDDDGRLIRLLWAIKHLKGEETVRDLIWNELLGDTNSWKLEDLLALMVPVGTTSDGRTSWPSMGEFDASSIDPLLGLSKVLDALKGQDGGLFDEDAFDRRRGPVDLESRRQYAVSVVARLAAKRGETQDEPEDDPSRPR
jgi:energy-coupling factor transporter ATP-binding protein EcfA2